MLGSWGTSCFSFSGSQLSQKNPNTRWFNSSTTPTDDIIPLEPIQSPQEILIREGDVSFGQTWAGVPEFLLRPEARLNRCISACCPDYDVPGQEKSWSHCIFVFGNISRPSKMLSLLFQGLEFLQLDCRGPFPKWRVPDVRPEDRSNIMLSDSISMQRSMYWYLPC